MNLSADDSRRFAEFPESLRALIESELAAGNEIAEFSGGHPAPPAGDCIKLARQVTTRPRASGDGLRFRERNSSLCSGEFTDERGFYFILEPPDQPPSEPDMDAIRRASAGNLDAITKIGQTRETGSGLEVDAKQLSKASAIPASVPRRALTLTETATGAKRLLHFQDKRPPHEIQFLLERKLMTLFAASLEDGRLTMRTKMNVVGAQYFIELRLEASLLSKNCYSLCVEASWEKQAATNQDYYRKTSDSWFGYWTRDLVPANPPTANAGSRKRYQNLCDAAMNAESHLDSVAAIQQAIVAEMKRGGTFSTSHKEGGTNIFWREGKFVRSDYGDYPDLKQFPDETEFLNMLRQFFNGELMRNTGQEQRSDFDAWKLILRRQISK